jgi:adenylate kinase
VPRVALTGTPGTGKSTAAARLPSTWKVTEVSDLARRMDASRAVPGPGGSVVREVDLERMRRTLPIVRTGSVEVVVGHLAHLLPIRDVVILRCHPQELERRLRVDRRRGRAEVHENLVAESVDVILEEARRLGRRVWEVDTTRRTPQEVSEIVARRVRHRGPSAYGKVDWLADPWVTEHLLDWAR